MLRKLLAGAGAAASATSSLPFHRVSNDAVHLIHGANLSSAACSGCPEISPPQTHPASSGISSLGTLPEPSPVRSQTTSISCSISTDEDGYRSAGKEQGSNGCAESLRSGCSYVAGAEALSPKDPTKAEVLSQEVLSVPHVAKAEGLPWDDSAKARYLSPEAVEKIVSHLGSIHKSSYAGAMQMLEHLFIRPSPGSVAWALSRLENNCDAALAFFSWAMKQPNNQLSYDEFHSMVVILVRMRRFESTLSLIRETVQSDSSLLAPHTVLHLLRTYCDTGQTEKAIATFNSLMEWGYQAGLLEFRSLLNYLCRSRKVAEAEKLLLGEENRFPFHTRSFNIILRGWCESQVQPHRAKQFWQTMEDKGLQHDVESYGLMISCLQKSRDLDGVLEMFGEMKSLGIDPDTKVYKGILAAMVKENFVKDAFDFIKKMKDEKGIVLGSRSLASMFWLACKGGSMEGAVELLEEMQRRGIPLLDRCLAPYGLSRVFEKLRTRKDIMPVLAALERARYSLPLHTYSTLITKFCMLQNYDTVSKLWQKMCSEGPKPDGRAYVSIIHGLSSTGKMGEAHGYYLDMRANGFNLQQRAELGYLIKRTTPRKRVVWRLLKVDNPKK